MLEYIDWRDRMLVYTTNKAIKQKFLDMGITLLEEKEVNEITYSFFRLNNPSIINNFSYEENKEIVVCKNTLFF